MGSPLWLLDRFSYHDVARAYLDCRTRKRRKRTSVVFEHEFEVNLDKLRKQLNTDSYCIGASQVFVVLHPKPREVWAAGFRDRIVHHLLYNCIGPFYESRFIEDSYACIKGRGTHRAIARLNTFCRSATEDWTKQAWCFKVDIKNFFVSINKNILWDILVKHVGEKSRTSRLLKQVLFHNPTEHAIIKTPDLLKYVPYHKSLWRCPEGCGLPIGNLTSQFLANVYNDGLDQFVKHKLRAKWYVRYVDDAVVLSHDREQLRDWFYQMDEWIWENRRLRFHPDKMSIVPVSHGVDFVGSVVLPYRVYARRLTVNSANKSVSRLLQAPDELPKRISVNSYLGLLRTVNTFNIRRKMVSCVERAIGIAHDSECTKLLIHQ